MALPACTGRSTSEKERRSERRSFFAACGAGDVCASRFLLKHEKETRRICKGNAASVYSVSGIYRKRS